MTAQTDTRSSIVAAVQQELNRFSKQVSAEVQRLQSELAAERAARAKSEETLKGLLPAIEQRLGEFTAQTKRRHDELELRIGRVSDEANAGLAHDRRQPPARTQCARTPWLRRAPGG